MVSFVQNIHDFQKQLSLSDADLLETSNLSSVQFNRLLKETCSDNVIYEFCLNFEIDYRTIYSDSGFTCMPLSNQFESYPYELKNVVTKRICKKLIDKYGSESVLKARLNKALPDKKLLVGRYISGKSGFDSEHIPIIKKAVSDIINDYDFDLLLATLMYSKIRNYNYNLVKSYYNVMYADIGQALGMTMSGVSNWGGHTYACIPDDKVSALGDVFGGFTYQEFKSVLITRKMLEGRVCKIASSNAANECCSSEANSVPKSVVNSEVDDLAQTDLMSYVTSEDSLQTSLKEEASQTEPIHATPMIDNILFGCTTIDAEKVNKMYNKLSNTDKAKVAQFISDLFFAAL